MSSSARQIWTVSRLTGRVQQLLRREMGEVWVRGELTNVSRPRSGHVYLSLRDAKAQLRGVIWRATAESLEGELEEGLQVLCRGRVDVFPPRGQYQLVISELERLGEGDLGRQLRRLHRRLEAEGLFDVRLKKLLPPLPRRIAVVTSPTGAAVRDFLEAIRGRGCGVSVFVVPCRVQGVAAADEIARAVERAANLEPSPDVIVLTRGGGSPEDLWCFNDEVLVRAVADCPVPTISAIGHEIDLVLSDLAADVRAMTPTQAAHLAAPSNQEVAERVERWGQRAEAAVRRRLAQAQARLQSLETAVARQRPQPLLVAARRRLASAGERLERSVYRQLEIAQQRTNALERQLQSLDPDAVLARGFSITSDRTGRVVTGADVRPGQLIETRLRDATLVSRVVATQPHAEQTRAD